LVEVDVYLLGGVERGELTEGVDAIWVYFYVLMVGGGAAWLGVVVGVDV
jgi:hypothetical protein